MASNSKDAIQYHSIGVSRAQSSEEESLKPEIELGRHPQLSVKRNLVTTFIIQIASLLWLAPVVTLLVLNFKGHVVGASAWCPNQDCQVGWFNIQSVAEHNLYKFDRQDHNILGVLQLVAKALEIWFELIAVALVYLITFLIAGKKEGLPIGFLTRPNEFSDFVGLFDPLMWTIMPPLRGAQSKSGKNLRRRVWLFISFTVFLCILCNLMGPATAVLVIPSLQWLDTNMVGNAVFGDLNSANPPLADNTTFFWLHSGYCTEEQFTSKNFSCGTASYSQNLDDWLMSYRDSVIFQGMTQQDTLTLALNQTFHAATGKQFNAQNTTLADILYWAPSRQLISTLSADQETIALLSKGYNESYVDNQTYTSLDPASTYTEYNTAVKLLLQRKGPALGAIVNMWADWNETYHWTTIVDNDRSIRCYNGYDISWTPLAEDSSRGDNYTKCIRLGSGWSVDSKHANFSIGGAYDMVNNNVGNPVTVDIYSSDKAAFFANETSPTWLPDDCLVVGTVGDPKACDYDRLFVIETDSPLYNRSTNVNTIEFTMSSSDGLSNVTFSVDFTAFLNYTQYQLDPSPLTNPLYLVETADLPSSGKSIPIDPAWTLAAWSADANGVLPSNRTASLMVLQQLTQMLDGPNESLYDYFVNTTGYDLDFISLIPIMQTLSLIDYTTTESTSSSATTKVSNPSHPLLQRNAKMWVWAYGMTSRTAIMGATVAIAGVLIVMVQFVLGFVDRRRYRSATQLLVAALEHAPQGEFSGMEHDEEGVARVRFNVRHLEGTAGQFGFRHAPGE